ncbi:hypothetical protein [Streptomyces sp. NPDC086787]
MKVFVPFSVNRTLVRIPPGAGVTGAVLVLTVLSVMVTGVVSLWIPAA